MNPYYIWAAIVALIPFFVEGWKIYNEVFDNSEQET